MALLLATDDGTTAAPAESLPSLSFPGVPVSSGDVRGVLFADDAPAWLKALKLRSAPAALSCSDEGVSSAGRDDEADLPKGWCACGNGRTSRCATPRMLLSLMLRVKRWSLLRRNGCSDAATAGVVVAAVPAVTRSPADDERRRLRGGRVV